MVVGYTPYVKSLADILTHQQQITSGMRKEVDRCRMALQLAREGKTVALVSSGDAGIYGMAGLALELAHEANGETQVKIVVVPGVTAASAAAAHLGAPLMADFATISLSDLLIPWSVIEKRLNAVAAADLVVCLYNPKSKTRTAPLENALTIFRNHRPKTTIVGVVGRAGAPSASIVLTRLDDIDESAVDMHTTLIIGNSQGQLLNDTWVTRRGYQL